jgi:L-rhamnose mutarotase
MDTLPQHPVMQRWWQHMKDIMRCHADGSPVVEPLPCLFHLD